jgi:hypothetical protein
VPLIATTLLLVQVVVAVVRNGPLADTACAPRVMAAVVLLVSVILVALLVVPTVCAAKVTDAGLKVTVLVPVPLMPTSCGLVGSLSLISKTPFFVPVLCGLKVRSTMQLAVGAKVLPDGGQAFEEMAKSVVSLKVIAPMVTLVVPLLVMVTFLAALATFTG